MLEAAEIIKMSMAERLQAMEQLWDSLCRGGGGEIASPAWHSEILSGRKTRAERGETKFLTLAQLKARFRDSAA